MPAEQNQNQFIRRFYPVFSTIFDHFFFWMIKTISMKPVGLQPFIEKK